MFLIVFLFALTLHFERTETLDCEEILKPVDDHSKVRGKWIVLASSSNNEQFQRAMNTSLGSWFDITENGKKTVMIHQDNLNGPCFFRVAHLKVSKDQVIYKFGKGKPKAEFTCQFIKTEKDSILGFLCDMDLWSHNKSIGQYIVLLGRTEHPSHEAKECFEQMVECAEMTNIYYPANEDMCEVEE